MKYKRPKIHITPTKGWINDPNGFSFYNGMFHVFAQHNPYDVKWGPMHWLHFVSKDLIEWKEVGIVMKPETDYDLELGCFSGNAFVENNTHYLFYTGVNKGRQTQCLAFSKDGENYQKHCKNPIISDVPEGYFIQDARDPKVIKVGDLYYLIIASKRENGTSILLYVGKDFDSFEFKNTIFDIESKEWCMIECPDIIILPSGKCVLLYSINHKVGNKYEGQVYYLFGELNHESFIFTPETKPRLLDYGFDFYAHETLSYEDKIFMIAWQGGVAKNCQDGEDGYVGQLSCVRELIFKNNKVLQSFPSNLDEKCHLVCDAFSHNLAEGYMSPYLDMHYRMKGEFILSNNSELIIQLNVGFIIKVNKEEKTISFTRSRNKEEIYCDDGSLLKDKIINIEEDLDVVNFDIIFDGFCLDILINDGRYSFTSNYFGKSDLGLVTLRSKNDVTIKTLKIYNIKL